MKKENDKKIKDTELENVSGGYKQTLCISTNYRGKVGYSRTTELSLEEALSLFHAGEFGNPDVEEKLRSYGFKRDRSSTQ